MQALTAAGVPTEISDNVRGALWAKLILNCAYNALSAVGRIAYGQLVQQPGVRDVMRDVVAECRAVAAAESITSSSSVAEGVSVETAPERSATAFAPDGITPACQLVPVLHRPSPPAPVQ